MDDWNEYARAVLGTLDDLTKGLKAVDDKVDQLQLQIAFVKGALALLGFLMGSGIVTTVVIFAVTR